MPDATELLSQDHRAVEQLFEQYKSSKDLGVVEEICTELTIHAAIEEKILYPVLGTEVPEGSGLREHAEHEHQEVKDAIFEIERLGYSDPRVDTYIQNIIKGVTEHVQEEEGDVFPKMRQALGEERLVSLGDELAAAKKDLAREAKTSGPLIDLTKDKLYELAQDKGIEGRSDMTKEELISAIRGSR